MFQKFKLFCLTAMKAVGDFMVAAGKDMHFGYELMTAEFYCPPREQPDPVVTKPEDVAKLPWAGNYDQDNDLFNAVDDYLTKEGDRNKRWAAERDVNHYGIGEDLPETPPPDFP